MTSTQSGNGAGALPRLDAADLVARAEAQPWHDPARYWGEHQTATAHLDPPIATLHWGALAWNAHDLLRRASGMPIRVASKSLRVRSVLDAVLALPGFAGVLAYTLPEAIWLARDVPGRAGIPDVVVGYPSVDRAAIATLAADPLLAARITLMVDSVDHLDLIEAAAGQAAAPIRVAIELDASYEAGPLGRIGVYRSPIRTAAQARALAEAIVRRPGLRLVGMMAYEAQIAGLADNPGSAAYGSLIRFLQRRSIAELRERRGEAVAAVRAVAELEFVNGGGTGSLETTSKDEAVTEAAAGSGLFGPHLFDHYRAFSPAPATAFALPVVRQPVSGMVTMLGGGWIASGPPGPDRVPLPVWPADVRYLPREGAGEVQSPLQGPGAARLRTGDRVWLRHTKSGEISEHVNELHVIDDGAVVGSVPTYRGEGQAFL